MKIQQITNTSDKVLVVQLEDGSAELAPNCGILNVRISESELKRIRPQVHVRMDLTEVKGILD